MAQIDHMNLKESQADRIRVLAVDDHEFVREAMAFVLSPFTDIEVVGLAPNGEEAVGLCEKLRPDVVLMDMALPGMDGATATQAIRARNPQVQVLALTSFHDEELVTRALQAGAVGYLLKGVSTKDLAAGIRSAHAGRPTLAMEAVQALSHAAQPGPKLGHDLSSREQEVLTLLVAGKTNFEIAEALIISVSTVKSHVSHIMSKLGAANRAEAASLAVKHNIIPP